MSEEGGIDYSKKHSELIRQYGEQAIQCCISEWNNLCPQYPLTNVTEVMHDKKWLFHSHDITLLKEEGGKGQISKIAFEINEHLTAKALRKHKDSPVIIVNCCTWWNCGKCRETHGWSEHITVDVIKNHVIDFPQITPASPHFFCCPLP